VQQEPGIEELAEADLCERVSGRRQASGDIQLGCPRVFGATQPVHCRGRVRGTLFARRTGPHFFAIRWRSVAK
jgi:hypothetical protein